MSRVCRNLRERLTLPEVDTVDRGVSISRLARGTDYAAYSRDQQRFVNASRPFSLSFKEWHFLRSAKLRMGRGHQ
ncbi:MAG: hypothetical protein GY847_38485 [Proteobacteria bacterium]|nr:hypothetical protein [Pseudomonadota bacterium]